MIKATDLTAKYLENFEGVDV